jgi:phenylalanyl-tRNA synthetase beta chain
MILSTNWLADYVQVAAPADAIVERLLLAGLNHESTAARAADTAIEVEVTSNRPDCLGHIGVARELSVLFDRPLHVPDPRPLEGGGDAAASVAVEIRSPDICPFYAARVIRGVRIGPSPAWLAERLATVGVASVNNVVDVTNYVMLECGQPLHAFDLAKIKSGRIVVRRAMPGESFTAINHKTYTLTDRMCVIADAERPVALAGVMGAADSEIGPHTTDILLESAQFAPLPVRAAARGLVLSSASSYRFERGPDPAAVDWASRRAAAMILDVAGGTLERGVVTAGELACSPAVVELDDARVAEVLGVDVPRDRQHAILLGLGFVPQPAVGPASSTRWQAPTWRRDVWRDIDLVEEIARIEGYDAVPEDCPITARPVELSAREIAIRRVSEVLVAAGFCEAMTRSVVAEPLESAGSPWTDEAPLVCQPALVRGADRLRRSLLPSLLEARAGSLAVAAPHGDLFEVAHAYLARRAPPPDDLRAVTPVEEPLLAAFVVEGGFFRAKGLAEAVLARLGVADAGIPEDVRVAYRPCEQGLLARGRTAEIVCEVAGQTVERVGVIGEVAPATLRAFGLDGPVAAVELRLDRLDFAVQRERMLVRPSDFPAVERDINIVVADNVAWGDIAVVISDTTGPLLEHCRLVQVWQDAQRLGNGKKSVVVSLRLRSAAGTLSGDEANRVVQDVVAACGRRVGATLRGE